jgi:hypothetical protein
MDIYNLAKVDATRDGARGTSLHGFNIIGVDGRPLVTFSFETLAEAQEAHKAMQAIKDEIDNASRRPLTAASASPQNTPWAVQRSQGSRRFVASACGPPVNPGGSGCRGMGDARADWGLC